MMKRLVPLSLAGTLALGAVLTSVHAQTEILPVAAGAATGEVTGTVMVVNTEKRMLTIRKPDGEFQVIHVPPEVKRLDEIKINDTLTISYLEAVAIDLQKGGETGEPVAVVTREVERDPGKKPAGNIQEAVTVTGVVEAVNEANSTATVRGPQRTVNVTVQDRALLTEVGVGDTVTVTFISSVAAKVE